MKKRLLALTLALLLCVALLPLPAAAATGEQTRLLQQMHYYGTAASCNMTPKQAADYAAAIRREYEGGKSRPNDTAYAALFHTGEGNAALLLVCGPDTESHQACTPDVMYPDRIRTFEYIDGQVKIVAEGGGYCDGYVCYIGGDIDGEWYTKEYYSNGHIGGGPVIQAVGGTPPDDLIPPSWYINDNPVSKAEYDQYVYENFTKDPPVIWCQAYWYAGAAPVQGLYPVADILAGLDAYAALPEKDLSQLTGPELLAEMGYYGDPNTCAMTRPMALAYRDALKGLSGDQVWTVLADHAGDGMPILLVCTENAVYEDGYDYMEPRFYAVWWDGKQAQVSDLDQDMKNHMGLKQGGINLLGYFVRSLGKTYLRIGKWTNTVGGCEGAIYYEVSNGRITHTGTTVDYTAERSFTDGFVRCEGKPPAGPKPVELPDEPDYYYSFAEADMASAGWTHESYGWSYDLREGEPSGQIERIENSTFVEAYPGTEEPALVEVGVTQPRMLSALEAYAQTAPDPIELPATSNLDLDFTKLKALRSADAVAKYLRDLLSAGEEPNDIAKTDLATFVESAVSSIATKSVSGGKKNRLRLSSSTVSDLAQEALEAKAALDDVLSEAGVELNKEPTVVLRVKWQDMSMGDPCQITLTPELAEALDGCTLQLLLGDSRHYFQFSPDDLQTLTDALGAFRLQLSKTGEGTYLLNFLDKSGDVLDAVDAPVTLALPADSPTATVMVSYAGGSDNWGGQYDPAAGVILFDARYSGQYEVLSNDLDISDISELGEESQDAIRFLVSKGYLDLDGSAFRPYDTLTRYEFTRALVGMFFALDKGQGCTFPDVEKESPFTPTWPPARPPASWPAWGTAPSAAGRTSTSSSF